ncbi:MAG: hypothetical protein AAFN77_11960 [Planctomycetota bacterium]
MASRQTIESDKHFVVTLKESTFECIAEELTVVEFARDHDDALLT